MARFILEAGGEDITVGGADVNVIGTNAGGEVITVVGGNVTLDASFTAGGDTIELPGEAESYTATLSGSRVVLTGGGITVSIPVGTAGVTVDFGGDDARELRIEGGVVVFGEQEIPAGDTPLDPGTDEIMTLTSALENLQATQEALNDFLAANDVDGDPLTVTTTADVDAALVAAQAALDADVLADGTDLQLAAVVVAEEADVAAAEADIAAVDGLDEAIEDYEAAWDAAVDASEQVTQAEAVLAGALATYNVLDPGPDVTVNADGTVAGVIVLDAGELVLDAGVTVTPEVTALLEASQAKEAADAVYDAAIVTLNDAQADVLALDPGAALYTALQIELSELEAAQAEVTERVELRADLQGAQALVTEQEGLLEDIADAEGAIVDLGFVPPVTVADGVIAGATADSDIFILDDGDGVGIAAIVDFAADGEDLLFVGAGYTTVALGDADDLANSDQGDVGALEVFVQQVGADTYLYFEDEAFAGNTSVGAFQGFTVILADYDAADVSLDATGYITFEDGAMA